MRLLDRIWYDKHWLVWLLVPLSLLYRLIIAIRQYFYRYGIFRSEKIAVPVIVVGNLTVGGTGKTPLLIALVELLQAHGFVPGVIGRGYGGKALEWPQCVTKDSDPSLVGDEPVLIAKNTNVPVFVGPNRVAAARALLSQFSLCNIILSDDGLQHYALARDIEMVVVDGLRRFGNGFCLPAGPLREPVRRLKTVDFVVCNGKAKAVEYAMSFAMTAIQSVMDPSIQLDMIALANKKIIAVAGIGNPDRFFQTLTELGLQFERRVFPDHHQFSKQDIQCADDEMILMTEKDAVKCVGFADERHWYLSGKAVLNDRFQCAFISLLESWRDKNLQ